MFFVVLPACLACCRPYVRVRVGARVRDEGADGRTHRTDEPQNGRTDDRTSGTRVCVRERAVAGRAVGRVAEVVFSVIFETFDH